MKRNEYVERLIDDGYSYFKGDKIIAYSHSYTKGMVFWRGADVSWFNVFGAKVRTVSKQKNQKIIGDE